MVIGIYEQYELGAYTIDECLFCYARSLVHVIVDMLIFSVFAAIVRRP
jgi:hypothetical protein